MTSRVEVIKQIIDSIGEPSYRFKQVCDFIFRESTCHYSEMFNLPKGLRDKIIEELGDEILTLKKLHEVSGQQVRKYLFSTTSGARIESVLMFYKDRKAASLCVSTQVGCAMNCKFCTTGTLVGFRQNLTADEIVDQILFFKKEGIEIESVFFSGMGEPFANAYFFDALKMLTHKDYLGMSARKFSISTVGIVPKIEYATYNFPQVNLALSLHFPTNDLRMKYMPISKAYPLEEVFKSLNNHIEKTHRKVFLAYVMLSGVNDSLDHAKELVSLVKHQKKNAYLYHINLIEFHEGTTEGSFKNPSRKQINDFRDYLLKNNVSVTIRQSFGEDIEAACGQLYAKYEKENF